MPELPDVEGFRRLVVEHLAGREIREVRVRNASLVRNATAADLRRALEGRTVTRVERQGKWLLVEAGEAEVLLHFGMTGELTWRATQDEPPHPHDRLQIMAGGGELRYRDQRKLQGIWLAADRQGARQVMGEQGPDALGVRASDFERALAGRRGGLKAVLMDQTAIAGLGNLLADEILWQARLHPRRRASDLDRSALSQLHRTMGRVLRASVRAGGVPVRRGWLTAVRDDESAPCPRCGGPLRRDRAGGRRTFWCPRCQGTGIAAGQPDPSLSRSAPAPPGPAPSA
jgi:formamidopyrimidine-DNA glycosylase